MMVVVVLLLLLLLVVVVVIEIPGTGGGEPLGFGITDM